MYIPVLKNWSSEIKAIETLNLHGILPHKRVIPFFKIIEEDWTVDGRMKYKNPIYLDNLVDGAKAFIDYHRCDISDYRSLDASKLGRVREMSSMPDAYLNSLSNLAECKNLTPVISIVSGVENPTQNQVLDFITKQRIREANRHVGFSIEKDFNSYKEVIENVLKKGDYLFLDIGEKNPKSQVVLFRKFEELNTEATKILLNSPRKRKIKNSDYEEHGWTNLIDNSARDIYIESRVFDGFGDYAGLRNDLKLNIKNKGLACAAIFIYSQSENKFRVYMNPNPKDGIKGLAKLREKLDMDRPLLDPKKTCIVFNQLEQNNSTGNNGNYAIWVTRTVIRYIQQIAEWLDRL